MINVLFIVQMPDTCIMPRIRLQQTKFYKILDERMTHHRFRYKEGLNEDTKLFKPKSRCRGGLYFTDLQNIVKFLEFGSLIAKVTIPEDALCIQESNDKWKANKIILSDIKRLEDWEMWQNPDFCLAAVQQNEEAFKYVQALDEEVFHLKCKIDKISPALYHVRPEDQTEAICLNAVEKDGWSLQYVKPKLQTEAICLKAVEHHGSALQHVPKKLQTEAICLVAVGKDGWALQYVPHELRTEAICLAALQRALEFVPRKLQTGSLCLPALQRSNNALQFVKFQTKACLAALRRDLWVLQFVPHKLRSKILCLTALQQALEFVPSKIHTEALCLAALQRDIFALRLVQSQTKAICLEAVQQYGGVQTKAICLAAVRQDGDQTIKSTLFTNQN